MKLENDVKELYDMQNHYQNDKERNEKKHV